MNLERLAELINAKWFEQMAWMESPDHLRVNWGEGEVTYQSLDHLSSSEKDMALSDWSIWCFMRLLELKKNPCIHELAGEFSALPMTQSFGLFAPTIAEACALALQQALEGE